MAQAVRSVLLLVVGKAPRLYLLEGGVNNAEDAEEAQRSQRKDLSWRA
jgi:hypothetical protein